MGVAVGIGESLGWLEDGAAEKTTNRKHAINKCFFELQLAEQQPFWAVIQRPRADLESLPNGNRKGNRSIFEGEGEGEGTEMETVGDGKEECEGGWVKREGEERGKEKGEGRETDKGRERAGNCFAQKIVFDFFPTQHNVFLDL